MKFFFLLSICWLANGVDLMAQTTEKSIAPKAKKSPHTMEIHGDVRTDDYYWLRDDQRKNPDVLNYLQQENDYSQQQLALVKQLQEQLYQEMVARLKPDEESVPYKKNDYYYYHRNEANKDYHINVRHFKSLQAKEEILLDENERAKGHEYYQLGDLTISSNNQLLAFSEDTVGNRQYTIYIKNLKTNKFYPETLQNTTGSIIWANDNKTIFYIKKHAQTLLGYQVYRHEIGQDAKNDVLVYEEMDDTFYMSIAKLSSEKYIAIHLSHTVMDEVRLIDADEPTSKPFVFYPRQRDFEYSLDHLNDTFFIKSNWQAKNFRLLKVQQDKFTNKNNWQEILPHQADTLLSGFNVFQNFIAINEKTKGINNIRILSQDLKYNKVIAFAEQVYTAQLDINAEANVDTVRYSYSSMTTPYSVFEYNYKDQTSKLLKQYSPQTKYHANLYQSERLEVKARDGKLIPVSLVYRKDKFNQDGSNPLLQYGYGSYGASVSPHFSLSRISLLDRGFVYAIAHIRGSQTLGRAWYEDGKMLNKKNTFTDFIDVTKALVKQKYAQPEKVYAQGGSAGGLLMGAVINMAPELYHGVIADVPFVDVVTTMLDESIPLTTGEYDEWGNPNEKQYYDYMLSYSPYDQVKKQNYPNMLVTTSLHDSQVGYWEPAKWVAKLRQYKTDDNLLLLDTNMQAGHGGKSGRYQAYEDIAKEYSFLFLLAEIKK